jgi:hypothetical protein
MIVFVERKSSMAKVVIAAAESYRIQIVDATSQKKAIHAKLSYNSQEI